MNALKSVMGKMFLYLPFVTKIIQLEILKFKQTDCRYSLFKYLRDCGIRVINKVQKNPSRGFGLLSNFT